MLIPYNQALSTLPDNWKMQNFLDYLTEKGLTEIPKNPMEIRGYKDWLKDRGYKPTSISALLVPVRELYRTLGIDTRKILRGPHNLSTFLKDPVSEENSLKLLQYVDKQGNLRDMTIIRLMLYLGLRDVEVSRMDYGDFYELEREKWIVKIWGKKRDQKDEQKTVTNGLLRVFLAYKEERGRTAGHLAENEPMFIGHKKHRLRPDVVSQIVNKLMVDAGIKTKENSYRITAHSLRHTAITKIAKITRDPFKVQQFGRFRDLKTPMIYTHLAEEPEILMDWEGGL